MKRLLLFFAVGAMLATVANPGLAANGSVRLSWDNCDPIVQNLDFTGPGQLAKLVASVTGSDAINNGHRIQVVVGPNVPDAWRFDAGACQLENWSVSHTGVSKTCPAFQGTQPLGLRQYAYDPLSQNAMIDIANAYDNFTPTSGTRYTLWQATFDHSFSNTGPRDPNVECGFADQAMCFAILTTEILLVGGLSEEFSVENDWVTWQDAGNGINCPGVPTEESTWGRVKHLYR